MSLYTVISHIHTLEPGEGVGYGGKYVRDMKRTIATLPIGYADGFLRAYKGFCVTVRTESGDFKAPVVGNICMDQCMIDITDIPARVGDKIVIFGEDPEDLTKLAALADTIEYEVLCLISARVPRILKNNK
jgi:alanine racemase